MNEMVVSINCITYNQEKYISEAIESILMQRTKFKFEILIHDDASTDKTAEIIRAFEKKYPSIVKPIYQSENQYSKGVNVLMLNSIRAKGKYVAICEGDDYWTDPNKLQKQVDYLENHKECSMCVHAVNMVDNYKNDLFLSIRPSRVDKIFTAEEVIQGGGGLFGTNSIMYPSIFEKNTPAFFETAPVGDYPLAIYLALKGTVYYIDEFMSAYRVGSEGSWVKKNSLSLDRKITHYDSIADMLEDINGYSEYKYDEVIKRTILMNKFNLLVAQKKYKEVKTGDFKIIYDKLSTDTKLKLIIDQYCPIVKRMYTVIKRKLHK